MYNYKIIFSKLKKTLLSKFIFLLCLYFFPLTLCALSSNYKTFLYVNHYIQHRRELRSMERKVHKKANFYPQDSECLSEEGKIKL